MSVSERLEPPRRGTNGRFPYVSRLGGIRGCQPASSEVEWGLHSGVSMRSRSHQDAATEKVVASEEVEAQLNEWMVALSPRPHWSTPGSFCSPECLKLLRLLVACKRRDLVRLRSEPIKAHRLAEYSSISEKDVSLWQVAASRRGAEDLKDETWSTFCHLRKLFPHGQFEPHGGAFPFCYVESRHGVVVTAGNVEPARMLEFMVDHGTPRLGIAGLEMGAIEGSNQEYCLPTGKLSLTWVEFTPAGFEILRKYFEARALAMSEALTKALGGGDPFGRAK